MTNALQMADPDERVLHAAGSLFRQKGFAATTVREIAAAANMLPGSLHYRYSSKDDILVTLMRRGVEQAMAAVRQAVAGLTDPLAVVKAGLAAHLELLCSGEHSLYVLLFDWHSLPERARYGVERERGRYEAFWDELLVGAHGTGKARMALDLQLVRHFGFGAANWVATWYRPEDGRTPAQIAESFWSYLAYGLLQEAHRPPNLEAHFASLLSTGE